MRDLKSSRLDWQINMYLWRCVADVRLGELKSIHR